jgi:hypothetical protein
MNTIDNNDECYEADGGVPTCARLLLPLPLLRAHWSSRSLHMSRRFLNL